MWHEARRSERKVHDMMDAARKRAQRRAVYLAKRRGGPSSCSRSPVPAAASTATTDCTRPPRTSRDFTDDEGLQHVHQQLEAKNSLLFAFERPRSTQLPVSKGSYSQVGFSYKGEDHEESHNLDSESEDEDDDEDDDEKDFSSDDSHDERMETIAKEFGIKRYKWLVYMDKKAKEEEKRQKEIIRGDPAIRKLSRKERRKASQMEREKEREAARLTGRAPHHDPYRASGGRILEALHVDPASAMSLEQEKNAKMLRPPISSPSSSSAIAKLSKTPLGTSSKTPQVQKDTAAEMAKKREQERHRQEKLAEARRINRYSHRNRSRSYSPSPTRYTELVEEQDQVLKHF
ncbi:splicing factor, arginine serine-rich 16 [Musa troglodytarum]|uniref:Splicing factor, arginine serine-rich 16 n=1 Tax=Musa troglodytarum TaxID=320322 RepID=A0A9E7L1U2_9LILI|nr:splicing factor, arginine serine-rich 16 [Musa troglodytarum]